MGNLVGDILAIPLPKGDPAFPLPLPLPTGEKPPIPLPTGEKPPIPLPV